ncbi:MAG: hypothetical protein ABIQ06_03565 [Caldimonas sp.]
MSGFAFRTSRLMLASIPFRSASLLVALAALAAVPAAHAAEKKPSRPAAATAAPKSPILTPAQLQQCVNQKERLHAQTDDALKDKAEIEVDKAGITRSGTGLAEELTTLDRTSDVAVDAYNAKVEQRDKLIETYQSRVTAYNLKAETVKATKEGYEQSCENRRYDERDLKDLKRKK